MIPPVNLITKISQKHNLFDSLIPVSNQSDSKECSISNVKAALEHAFYEGFNQGFKSGKDDAKMNKSKIECITVSQIFRNRG